MSKKTLLQINVTANWGSTGKIAEQIGVCAQQHGWESYIAYGRYMNPSENHLIKIGSQLDVYEHYAESRLLDNEGLASRRATRHFLRQVDEIHPDIVHLHNIHDHYLNYPLLFHYLAERNIPVVWTFHDCWAFTGDCGHFVIAQCERWKTGCHNCPQMPRLTPDCTKRNYLAKKEAFTALKNLTIVPVSKWAEGLIRESFLAKYPIQTIYNGIDINVFKTEASNLRQRLDLGNKFVMVGVASTWDMAKGLADYYKLNDHLPEGYQIILIGMTKKQIAQLPKGIIGIERTQNQKELAQYYSMADITLNLSYQETFGLTTVEGMACGTPAIVYNKTASPELVSEDTGVIVPAGDIPALVSAIKNMKENPLSSTACKQRVEAMFDKNKCFTQYIDLYNQLL